MSKEKNSLPNSRVKPQRNRVGRNVNSYQENKLDAIYFKPEAKKPVKGEDKPFKRVDKEIIKFKNEKRDIEFHPLSIQWHPYPYITTPEIYLFNAEDDEDYKPSPALPEEIVERVILDTKFAKSLVNDFVSQSIESHVRDIVLTFTNRQGPANKPPDNVQTVSQGTLSQATSNHFHDGKKMKNSKEDNAYEAITEDMLKEELHSHLKHLLWNALDHKAIFLDEETYRALSKDSIKSLAITSEQRVKLKNHVIQVGRGLQKSNNGHYEYSAFNIMKTRNYVYQFHKTWRELMTTDNYAYRELKLKFCNEAAWNYFSKECMEAVELFMIEMDTEETKNRTLNTFNSLRSPLHHETPLSRVRTADTEVTNNNLHT